MIGLPVDRYLCSGVPRIDGDTVGPEGCLGADAGWCELIHVLPTTMLLDDLVNSTGLEIWVVFISDSEPDPGANTVPDSVANPEPD